MENNLSLAMSVVKLKNGVSFGTKSASLIEVTKSAVEPDATMSYNTSTQKYAKWGIDNDYPQRILDANNSEGTSSGAKKFKIDAHYGGGLYFYKKVKSNGKIIEEPLLFDEDIPSEIQDFYFDNDFENFQQSIISDFEWWSFFHVQYIPNKAKNKIVKVNWRRTKDVRPALRSILSGKIESFYLSGKWPNPQDGEIAVLPSFDHTNPFSKPNAVYRHQVISVDRDYFPTPYWQSNAKWLSVASNIPLWINSNIDNSINIKYHVKIPQEYFTSLYPRDPYNSDKEHQKAMADAEEALKNKIDEMLAGAKNASKVFYSKVAIDEEGKPIPGWEIIELKNEIKDSAWLNAYGTAAAGIATAEGVPPSLQGLILSNGLGTGSASDVREQFNFYLQLKTVIPRQTTLEPFNNFLRRFNKWGNIYLGYKNIVLQTVDENKSGYATSGEQNPTTQNK